MTSKDVNPLPLIEEALGQFSEARIFSTFYIIGAYHHLQIREEDIHKTAIQTRIGSLEWLVLCFALKNAPTALLGV